MFANSSQSKKDSGRKSTDSSSKKSSKGPMKDDMVNKVNPEEVIFAMDIGTRTVIGIVGIQEKGKFKVLAADIIEHKSRAMMDGQIHDIAEVARVVKEIKESLEKKLGFNLSKVAVAAAGRVLKTSQVRVEIECDSTKEIDRELISSLEIEGIQKAQMQLDSELSGEDKTQFYCVGYSVINYYLNGYVISELSGHKGKKAGADILATFLPHIVVDSMYTVMGRVGLEIINLTLEPIAAINVTIPKELRLLNLALVDIGAGTSDIAITRNGSVVAYGMASIAGDEITERIAQHYLVDFNTAEKIKISISDKSDKVTFTDILNTKRNISVSEIVEVIKPSIEFLAQTISEKILEFNHKAPNAVFLVGGGSQIPGLTSSISSIMGLAEDRVVVRGRGDIAGIKYNSKKLAGPEAITPFGIAVTAQIQRGQDFMNVMVNGQNIRLFNSKKLIVADALILVGFSPAKLIGRTGKSINYELNGVKQTVRGEIGKSAEILVNDKLANLETVLSSGDNIVVTPAEDGRNAKLEVVDLIRNSGKINVSLNGTNITLEPKIFINGKAVDIKENIKDGDTVTIEEIVTIDDLLKVCEIDTSEFDITVNEATSVEGYVLQDSDVICYTAKSLQRNTTPGDLCNGDGYYEKDTDQLYDGDNISLYTVDSAFSDEEQEIKDVLAVGKNLDIIVNGESKSIHSENSQFIFVDIFNYLDFDLSNPKGNIVLKLNGRKAGFTDVIKPGDIIDIYWDKLT
ncbi:MAG: Cell division protein FtsA [Firmicutes bacterium ADurb.Bin419]|nr:MAG: Cell division protein FtsA [Firmicutes bacterium ADurb.Bin419]